MVRFQRSARVKAGRVLDAVKWATEIADYVSAKYPETPVRVFTERYGAIGAIYWVADFPDVATMDEVLSRLLDGSGEDTVMVLVGEDPVEPAPEPSEEPAPEEEQSS